MNRLTNFPCVKGYLILTVCFALTVGLVQGQVTPTPYWMDLYGVATYLDSVPIPEGAQIKVFDPDSVLCGFWQVDHSGYYGVMAAYGDDPSSPLDEGAEPGDSLRFFVNDIPATPIGPDAPIWQDHVLRHIELQGQSPDLIISQIICPSTVNYYAQVPISAVVKNIGAVLRNKPFYVKFEEDGNYLYQVLVNHTFAPGDSLTVTYNWSAEEVSIISVCADRGHLPVEDNLVYESSESNNCNQRSITVLKPDLIISRFSVPDTLNLYSIVPIEVVVRNIGADLANRSFFVRLEKDGSYVSHQEITAPIPHQDSVIVIFNWQATSGDTLKVYADQGQDPIQNNRVVELDETNNTARHHITMMLPDLIISSLSYPGTILEGHVVQFSAWVKNIGANLSNRSFFVRFDIDNQFLYKGSVTQSIAHNDSVQITCSWLATLSDSISVRVDYGYLPYENNLVSETNELNNDRKSQLVVLPLPDLFFLQELVILTPTNPIAGDSFQIAVNVINSGGVSTDSIVVRFSLEGTREAIGDDQIIPSLGPGEHTTVSLMVQAPLVDDVINVDIDPDNSIPESDELNNSLEQAILVFTIDNIAVNLQCPHTSTTPGGNLIYNISVTNNNPASDHFSLEVQGLPPAWFALSNQSGDAASHGYFSTNLEIRVPDSTSAIGNYPFQVIAHSQVLDDTVRGSGSFQVQMAIPIWDLTPNDGIIIGSQDLNITWRTPSITSTAVYYKLASDTAYTLIPGSPGREHYVHLQNLSREAFYDWYVQSVSTWGDTTSAARQFYVSTGIVFTQDVYNYTVERNYNQLVEVSVRNDDNVSRTLLLEVNNPYHDIAIGFIGDGSMDSVITLNPGGQFDATLAFHAPDAETLFYELPLVLTCVVPGDTLHDYALADFHIDAPVVNYEVVYLGRDEGSLANHYRVINHGDDLTDFRVWATGDLVDLVQFKPIISHAFIPAGGSIEFRAIPILERLIEMGGGRSAIPPEDLMIENGKLIAVRSNYVRSIMGNLRTGGLGAGGGGQSSSLSPNFEIPPDLWLFFIEVSCSERVDIYRYRCTNAGLDSFLVGFYYRGGCDNGAQNQRLTSASIGVRFVVGGILSGVTRDFHIRVNGQEVGSILHSIPNGLYTFEFDPSILNMVEGAITQNSIVIDPGPEASWNAGHFFYTTQITLTFNYGGSGSRILGCFHVNIVAENFGQAMDYLCTAYPEFCSANNCWISQYRAAQLYRHCEPCNPCTDRSCPSQKYKCEYKRIADPVNVAFGNFYNNFTDITLPGQGLYLKLERWYDTMDRNLDGPLGYGWTFTYNDQLSFSGDTVEVGYSNGNGEKYISNHDSTFRPFIGSMGELYFTGDSTFLLIQKDQTEYRFNSDGKLLSVQDKNGNTIACAYDSLWNLISATNDLGRQLTFSYEGIHISAVHDDAGRSVSYSYDIYGNLISCEDVDHFITEYSYDSWHRITGITDPNGYTRAQNEYDAQNRVVSQRDGKNILTTFEYNDPLRQVAQTRYPLEGPPQVTIYEFDEYRNLTRRVDPLGNEEIMEYDNMDNIEKVVDGNGYEYYYEFDGNGNIIRETNPLGNERHFQYNSNNNLISETNFMGNPTTFSYDEDGNKTSRQNELNHTRHWNYDESGNVISEINENGNTTHYIYNPATNYLMVEINPMNDSTLYAYDNLGRKISITYPNGSHTYFTYDNRGNLLSESDDVGFIREYEYDGNGNQGLIRDGTGNETHFTYDAYNKKMWEVSAHGDTTYYNYDNCGCANGQLKSMTDPNGNTTTYEYDEEGNLIRIDNPDGTYRTFTYDANRNRLTETDENHHTIQYQYDALNRLTMKTTPEGYQEQYEFDPESRMVLKEDYNHNETHFQYDALGRLVHTTDPLGGESERVYDPIGNVQEEIDPLENHTYYQYDVLSRLVQLTDPLGFIETYEYDEMGNTIRVVNKDFASTAYTYDYRNRLTTELNALGGFKRYYYDLANNRTAYVNENSDSTAYRYDEMNRLVQTINPLGYFKHTGYNANGNVIWETDWRGDTTRYTYDVRNRVTQTINELGGISRIYYDGVGNVLSAVNARGDSTRFIYDDDNRMVTSIDPEGRMTVWAFDGNGNRLTEMNALGYTTQYQYDGLNRLISTITPLGKTTTRQYDALGRLTQEIDPNNHSKDYTYDPLGRRLSESNGNNNITHFGYDGVGNKTSVTDSRGNVTTFTYDLLNRLIREEDPLHHLKEWTYDGVGNQIGRRDEEGRVTNYEYDPLVRLVRTIYPDTSTVELTYDANSNRTQMVDPNGTTLFEYDVLDRLVRYTDTFSQTVVHEYDLADSRTLTRYPDGREVQYHYNHNSRLTEVIGWTGVDSSGNPEDDGMRGVPRTRRAPRAVDENEPLTTYTYDAAGNMIRINYPNGVVATYTYDHDNKITRLENVSPDSVIFSRFEYLYDNAGNRTGITSSYMDSTVVARYGGANVYATAALISQELYSESVSEVILTHAHMWWNNLALAPFAVHRGDPILFTDGISLDNTPETKLEILRALGLSQDQPHRNQGNQPVPPRQPQPQNNPNQQRGQGNRNITPPHQESPIRSNQAPSQSTERRLLDESRNRVLIIGSVVEISDLVERQLQDLGIEVERLDGLNRYDLARQMNAEVGVPTEGDFQGTAVVVPGDRFANAMSVSALAVKHGLPIVVTDGDSLSAIAAQSLTNLNAQNVILVGNTDELSDDISDDITDLGIQITDRLTGSNAYALSATVTEYDFTHYANPRVTFIANGERFQDALVAATLTAANNGLLILSHPSSLNTATSNWFGIRGRQLCDIKVVGTEAEMSNTVFTQIRNVVPPLGLNTKHTNYEYDGANQLTRSESTVGELAIYTYDAVGNRIRLISEMDTVNYVYDVNNQLTQQTSAHEGITAFAYDDCGNQASETHSGQTKTYTYNFDNLLLTVESPSDTLEYRYNGANNRIYSDISGEITRFVNDLSQSMVYVLVDLDESNQPENTYIIGLGLVGFEDITGAQRYFHYDALGSVSNLSDATGASTDAYEYGDFGNLRASRGNTENRFCYVGQYGVEKVFNEIYYMRFRFYASYYGRFIGEDGLGIGVGSNLYFYASNNPIIYTDPSGQFRMPPGWEFGFGGSVRCCGFLGYYPPPIPWAWCVKVAIKATAQNCCENYEMRVQINASFDITAGIYFGPTVGVWVPGPIKCKGSFDKEYPKPSFGSPRDTCDPPGWSGHACGTVSAGYKHWTVGCEACYTFGRDWSWRCGLGTGYGTGACISGGITHSWIL